MKLDEGFVEKIVRQILSVTRPERIILFGSAATGTMTADSDVDLLVIERDFGNPRQESIRLRSALADLNFAVDVFAMSPERCAETKDIIGGLAYPANKYGKVIYEAT